MGRKQGKKGKKGNNKTVVKSSKIVKSSFASSSRQQTNSETKSIDNNERSNEKDSCSKTSTSDIFSSLFGSGTNVTTSNTNDLFSSSQANKFQQASKGRIIKNQSCLNTANGVKSTKGTQVNPCKEERQIIINKRRKRDLSKSSIDDINSITVSLPALSTSHDSNDDDNDEGEIQNGIMRLFTNQADAIMREKGVLIIKGDESNNTNFFETPLLNSMSLKATQIENDVCDRLRKKGKIWEAQDDQQHAEIEKNCAFQYHEVASRCLGRLDIRYGMNQKPFSNKSVIENKYLLPIMQSLLGKSAKLVYAGLILSFPKSADQPWHQDGTALFDENDGFSTDMHLPPYALNVFVPLEDITEEIGPTEFHIGSHFGDVAKNIIQPSSSDQTNVQCNKEETAVGPLLKRGDVLVYDYRVCHRGTSNLSLNKTRPMLYLMYARPWFHEHLNFGDEQLFEK